MSELKCPLCSGSSTTYHIQKEREFLQCSLCLSVFLNPKDYLSIEEELKHYNFHNNNPEDVRYRNFLSPVTNRILTDFGKQHEGLDFGSGTGSPIVKVLGDNGYNISQFDLFYHNHPEVLKKQYDYISCTETAEHFKDPYTEFKQLRNMLKTKSKLYVMTDRFNPNRDFGTWFYKTDPTHVFLYSDEAFEWIQKEFGFKSVDFTTRVVILGF
ncbi:MAG: class I SAM-dependent methyltransferase [Bacteroidia bacterium]